MAILSISKQLLFLPLNLNCLDSNLEHNRKFICFARTCLTSNYWLIESPVQVACSKFSNFNSNFLSRLYSFRFSLSPLSLFSCHLVQPIPLSLLYPTSLCLFPSILSQKHKKTLPGLGQHTTTDCCSREETRIEEVAFPHPARDPSSRQSPPFILINESFIELSMRMVERQKTFYLTNLPASSKSARVSCVGRENELYLFSRKESNKPLGRFFSNQNLLSCGSLF